MPQIIHKFLTFKLIACFCPIFQCISLSLFLFHLLPSTSLPPRADINFYFIPMFPSLPRANSPFQLPFLLLSLCLLKHTDYEVKRLCLIGQTGRGRIESMQRRREVVGCQREVLLWVGSMLLHSTSGNQHHWMQCGQNMGNELNLNWNFITALTCKVQIKCNCAIQKHK